jgi:hypothetical protein
MPFSDLRKNLIPVGEQADLVEDDRPLPEDFRTPTIYPSNPDYFIRIYYDASRFPNERALQDLYDRMLLKYAPRSVGLVQLAPKSLEYQSLSSFTEMERRFITDGVVADVEGRMFGSGGSETIFAKRNSVALNANAMAMATLLLAPGHNVLPEARENETRKDTVFRAMTPLLGLEVDPRDPERRKIFPLAEHNGLLLGCRDFTIERRLHFAKETTAKLAVEKGARKEAKVAIFDRKIECVKEQLLFEFEHAARLFRENLLDPTLRPSGISRAMILTWYSQVIAAARKVCWLVSAEQHQSVAAQSLHDERAAHRRMIGDHNTLIDGMSWDAFIADRIFKLDGEITEIAEAQATVRGAVDMIYKITWDDEILAALMGATYRSDTDISESPFQNRHIFVRCLAYWIGSLKRKRTATIDWYTAEGILEVCRGEYSSTLLLSQFPRATWVELEEIAEAITNGGPVTEIEVSYTWTRDLDAPYKCEERDGTLALEGPLLCFPVLAATEWREKARTIETLRGFEVKGPRRR